MTNELEPDAARWLISEPARPFIDEAHAALRAGVSELDLLVRVRGKGLTQDQASAVLSCARTRDRAGDLLITSHALEQASPAACAAWRARRFSVAPRIVDLCCGAGGDAVQLGHVAPVVGLDIDESRVILAGHNATVSQADVDVVVADALRAPLPLIGFVHADPSRRSGGRRVKRADDYRPGLGALLAAMSEARGACVLLSPAVALDDPAIPEDAELEFIQLGTDLVECAMWGGDLRAGAAATATLLPEGLSVGRSGSPERLPAGPLGTYLIEPVPSAVRARVHEQLGADAGMRKLARGRALLTADRTPGPSPWWRAWRVEADIPLRARTISTWLRAADPLPVEISLHGHAADVDALWRSIGKPERGPRGRRLFVVRMDRGVRVIACVPV